ncbi:MAG: HEAT repeat domain-containing protein, partial [Verrucomicrobiae bacterium]|nr:HEAT repeat domain-containing protein [Verrucomicrobiae bacterium]
GNRVQNTDPQRFEQISQYALNAASRPGDHDTQIRNLAVVANLGPQEVPAFVAQAFTSGDATLRRASVESLERIKSDQANQMITRALRDDDENVRVAAAKLLADQSRPNAVNLLSQTLAEDNSETVRARALLSLSQLAETDPRAASQIAHAAQQNSSAEVRDLAAKLLAASTNHSQGR